jgi:hypothetical protein
MTQDCKVAEAGQWGASMLRQRIEISLRAGRGLGLQSLCLVADHGQRQFRTKAFRPRITIRRAVSNATVHWHEAASEAWRSYQSARTQVLRPLPEGERQVGPPPLNVANLLAMQLPGRPAQQAPRPLRGKVVLNPVAIPGIKGDSFSVTLQAVPNGSAITRVEIGGGQPDLDWKPNGPLSGTATLKANLVAPIWDGTRWFVQVKVYYTQPDGTPRIAYENLGILRPPPKPKPQA